ncbi:MAG: hypothetical protein IPO40_16885 [Fibrobacteres bacterium]|nr:hypothetical protein [Fibrobacterota bacterium]
MSRSRLSLLPVCCLWVVFGVACKSSNQEASSQVGAKDSIVAQAASSQAAPAADLPEIPAPLRQWIWNTLRGSGELGWVDSFVATDLSKRTRLSHSGGTWTVDFHGLEVGILGDATDENWTDIDVRVLVAGTRLCSPGGRSPHSSQIAVKLEGLDQVRCSEKDDERAVRHWFSAQFGRAPSGAQLRIVPGHGVAFLRMECKSPDTLRRIGLLRNIPMDTLEIDGCVLPVQEQTALPDRIGRLGLFGVNGRVFAYSGRIEEQLRIERGDFTWVSLGPSHDDSKVHAAAGARLSLVGLAVCRPELVSRLSAQGFRVDSSRCDAYPSDLFTERDLWDKTFEETRSGANAAKGSAGLTYEDLPVYDTNALPKSEAIGIDDDPFGDPGPTPLTPRIVRYGKDGIDFDGGLNSHYFLRGSALRAKVHGKEIRSGMTRTQLIAIMGKPSLDKGEFLAWRSHMECDQEPFSIQARFDAQGKLVGWFDRSDPMCGC